MNCNENNWIILIDVGVLTHANEMRFSLIHARVYQHFVAVVALEMRELSEEGLSCSYPWIHSGAALRFTKTSPMHNNRGRKNLQEKFSIDKKMSYRISFLGIKKMWDEMHILNPIPSAV